MNTEEDDAAGIRMCPTRMDGAPVLFAHKVTASQCQDRQAGSYHKCFTCSFNNAYVAKRADEVVGGGLATIGTPDEDTIVMEIVIPGWVDDDEALDHAGAIADEVDSVYRAFGGRGLRVKRVHFWKRAVIALRNLRIG